MDQRDSVVGSTEQLEAVVEAAESAGEGVVMEEGGGESGGDDVEGRLGEVGGNIGTKVAEIDTEIGICVEMRKSEDMVVGEGGAGRKNGSGSRNCDSQSHGCVGLDER